MKSFLKWLAAVLVVFALLLFVLFIIISSLIDTKPKIVQNSFLHLNLSGSIPEYAAPDALEEALGKVTIDMKRIRDNLEKAKIDDRINGVILQIGLLSIGYGKAQELHHLILDFRKSGKKIYAYLGTELAFTKDYYIATACDSIYMPPTANLFITGVSFETTFYKDFFEKIGVEAEFAQIGKYKNAPDIYTRNSMSPYHRQVLQNLVDYYYAEIVRVISAQRGISQEKVDEFINKQTGLTGSEAAELGLIDGATYLGEVEEKLNLPGQSLRRVSASDYALIPASSLKIRNKSRIAVVNCVGTIAGGTDYTDPILGTLVGANSVVENLKQASRSSSIKAIILRIDSPGGSATAAEIIWNAVREASQKKPVIASVADYAASGGYYIAMGADTMITTPASLVGSIGIFAGKFNLKNLYKKLNINNETLQRGDNANLFSISEPWTKSERAVIERLIDNFYHEFVKRVAEARNLDLQRVYDLAEGRVWIGEEAVRAGLFDFTGNFQDAIATAKSMAKIDSAESVRLVYYPKSKSLLNQILSTVHMHYNFFNDIQRLSVIKFVEYFENIQNRPLALMPFLLRIN